MKTRGLLVFDWPTRIYHWLFAGMFIFSYLVAENVDDESALFSYHMLVGLMYFPLLLFRLGRGIFSGGKANFRYFNLNLKDLGRYLKNVLRPHQEREFRYNPAVSWVATIMMICAIGLASTGVLMAIGDKEAFEDFHEIFANVFLATAIAHIMGIFLYTIINRYPIGLSMITGKQPIQNAELQDVPTRPILGFSLVIVMLVGLGYIFFKFDSQTRQLDLFGKVLSLGESEKDGDNDND